MDINSADDASSMSDSADASDVNISIRTFTINGRLDALRAVPLRSAIDATLEQGITRVVVDLSEATFVDSAGLAALANGMKHARRLGGDLRVVSSRHADAQRVFSLTRFDQVFTMAPTASELVASW